jgi:3-hydroxy-9,10-secoandrosta-1,3,5(10)-triene-9,17-dione monooxygenase
MKQGESMTRVDVPIVLVQELIERTESLLPGIAERALETERERRIPDATLREIEAAQLNRILHPARHGGLGLDYDAFFEIAWRISSACGSTGWVFSVSSVHNWQVGLADEQAQDEFFAAGDVWSCSAFNPSGAQVEPAADGWRVSGRWQYSSGCLHADWGLLGAFVPESPAPVLLLVPCSDFTIEDTWHVSGLRGTGSNDIVIDEPVFVPSHRSVPLGGPDPVAVAKNERGSYGAVGPSLIPWTLATPVLGMAQGALTTFEDKTRSRVSAFSHKDVAKMAGPQMRISAAASAIDAALALARQDIAELIARGERGDAFTDEDRVRFRRDHAYAVNLAYDATMLLARASGASSLFDSHPMQRFVRDVHAGSMQLIANWDEQAESYGRVRMGLEPNAQMW